jgi:succinyl-CoA synthetase alpha subunit
MGHAGAIISGGKGDAKSKIACLEANGIKVVNNPSKMGEAMYNLFKEGGVQSHL